MPGTTAGFRWLPLLLLFALGAMWGANPTFAKAIGAQGVSPPSVIFWQTLGAGALLLLACAVRGVRLPTDRRALLYYAYMGWLCIDVAYMTVVVVVRHIPVGQLAVITMLSPLLTYLFALLLRLERPQALRAAGILLGLAGVAILVLPRGSLPSEASLGWALLALIVPTGYASGNVFAELGRPAGADSVALAAGTMIAAALGAALTAFVGDSFHPVWADPGRAEMLLAGFAAMTAVAFLVFQAIVALAGAVYLGQVGYLVTLAGIGWGMLFFGETHSHWLWFAVATVFAGVALVNFGPRRPGPRATMRQDTA
ncbi:MAG: DMT family transporter [Alphaproteobacteria bacterium]